MTLDLPGLAHRMQNAILERNAQIIIKGRTPENQSKFS